MRAALSQSSASPLRLRGVIVSFLLAFGLSSATLAQVATTTALSISTPSVAVGVPTLLTATVTDASSRTVLLGTVTFYDGSRAVGSAQIVSHGEGAYAQGTANLKTESFSVGANSITAVFAGTTSDLTSTSSAKTVTVTGKSATATVLSSTGVAGDYTLTAALQAFGVGLPTGNIDFLDTTTDTSLGTAPLSGATWMTDLFVSSMPAVGGSPGGVIAGDFNGDGFLDLATANNDGDISVLIGNGDGTFKPQVTYGAGGFPANIYTGDFNNDGRLDLAVVNYIDGAVGILLGNGDGTFQPQTDYGSANGAVDANIGDFNRDGSLDLVMTSRYGSAVEVLIGNGNGTFQAQQTYTVGYGPWEVRVSDMNGDGIPDLVVTANPPGVVNVLLGKGDGTFEAAVTYPFGAGPYLAVGDLNGDGKPDVILANGSANQIVVALNTGGGNLGTPTTYPLKGNAGQPVIVDVNQDGIPDIAISVNDSSNSANNNIQVLLGNGNGTFQPAAVYVPNLTLPNFMITGDFNGDGRPDLAETTGVQNAEVVVLNGQAASLQLTDVSLPGTGTAQVVANYSGDTNFALSISNALDLATGTEAVVGFAGTQPSQNFGNANVCTPGLTTPAPCSTTVSLSYNVTDSGPMGTPKVLTLGAPNLDFTLAAGSTCTGEVTAGTPCIVNVNFTPKYAGGRPGAVELTDNTGNVIATTLIYGVGTGPQIGFNGGAHINLPLSGLQGGPHGVAMDGFGNIFVSDVIGNAVLELPVGGGPTTTLPFNGLFHPQGVALDGAGDLFVADSLNGRVLELPAGANTQVTVPFVGISDAGAYGVGVDLAGDVLIADINHNNVLELPVGDGAQITLPFSGLAQPQSVATDGRGDVFVYESDSRVVELPSGGAQVTLPFTGLDGGWAAVDAGGSVFGTQYSTGLILELPGGNGPQVEPFSGLAQPVGVAVELTGDLLVFGDGNPGPYGGSLTEIQRSQPPPLNFGNVASGTSATLPLTIINTGTGTLTFMPSINKPAFKIVTPEQSTCLTGITAAQSCTLQIEFSATGTETENGLLTLQTNGATNATVSLQGTAGLAVQITSLSANYGALYAIMELTGINFGATQGSSTVTFNGIVAPVLSWSNTSITVTVPYRATTGNILVTVAGEASNGVPFTVEPTPTITGMSPTDGVVGTLVTITGTNLLDAQGHGTVYLYDTELPIVSQSSTSLQMRIPTGAVSGIMNVHINGVGLATPVFTVPGSPAQPHLSSLSTSYGAPYAVVTLTGENFGAVQGSSTVTFNGVVAPTVWGNSCIIVAVPLHATTGNVVVTVAGQASNGIAFTVEPPLSVTGISPSSGPVGTTVTITGENLVDAEERGTVYFGGMSLPILNPSNTSIQVVIPAGATSGAFDVHINGVGVYTSTFTVD